MFATDLTPALPVPEAEQPEQPAYLSIPDVADGRRQVQALMKARQGLVGLRSQLLQLYGGRCAISEADVADVLDVVQIIPSTSEQSHIPANALLLRADLHNLFDQHLIAIDTATMQVVISPLLERSSYADLAGRPLRLPEHPADWPGTQLLDMHRRQLRQMAIASPLRSTAQSVRDALPTVADLPPQPAHPALSSSGAILQPFGEQILRNKSCVNSVAFHHDGQILAAGCWDGLVRLWRINNGHLINTLNGGAGEINSVIFSPDGSFVAGATRNHIVQIWSMADGALVRTLQDHQGAVFGVAFSPDGRFIASGSWDRTLRLWRLSDGALMHTLESHRGAVNSVAFSPDGQLVASASHDRVVRLWRIADGQLVHQLQGHTDAVFGVAFSPDGATLASASCDRTVRLWNVADGEAARVLSGHRGAVFALAYSPDGEFIVSGDYDKIVRLWRTGDGTPLHEVYQHIEGITGLACSSDGQIVASASFDATVRLWQITTR